MGRANDSGNAAGRAETPGRQARSGREAPVPAAQAGAPDDGLPMPQRVWAIASVALAIAMTVAKFIYPSRLLGRGVGLNAMVASVAAAVGPSMAAAFSALRLSIR